MEDLNDCNVLDDIDDEDIHPTECEYCGRQIEDWYETGALCYRCYMKEYYPEEDSY